MNFINRIKSGWTVLKFIRVGLGSLILYSSAQGGNIGGIILGSLFTLFALLTDGSCCAVGSCYTPVKKNISSTNETIEYEELGAK